jgi:hypothetical protein
MKGLTQPLGERDSAADLAFDIKVGRSPLKHYLLIERSEFRLQMGAI